MSSSATQVAKSKSDYRGASHVRWIGAAFILFMAHVAYLDRIVFSVTANPIMKELSITPVQFGMITTLFSMGYFVFQIPGALTVERFGSRIMGAIALIFWSVFTALTGAVRGLTGLSVVRCLFGIGEGPLFPAANHFLAHWVTKQERGRASSLMNAGCFTAPVIGPPIIVAVVAALGWRAAFYILGVLGILTAVVWYVSMRGRPSEHSWVNAQELALITDNNDISTQTPQAKSKTKAPWGLFLRQRSFWAIAAGYFGTMWTVQFFMYWLPYYLQVAKHLSFKSMGFYTSVPWIFIVVGVLTAGTLSDFLLKNGFSRFMARNMVCVIGLAIAAAALVLSTSAHSVVGNVLWLSLALGMTGFAQTLSWSLATDIGQKFTSTVSSWMNTWGFIAASIVPTMAALIAEKYGWNQVLIFNAFVMLIGVTGFLLIKSDEPLRQS